MPYYPDQQGAPQNSIIGGASLWVMGGKKPEEYKGVAKFFTFLSDTDRQVEVHKASGYLPITKAAYAKTKESGYYKENPYLETPLLELTNKEPTENSRGLAPRQHGAVARRVGRGVRGRARRQEEREGSARRGGRARQHDAAAVRAHGDEVVLAILRRLRAAVAARSVAGGDLTPAPIRSTAVARSRMRGRE